MSLAEDLIQPMLDDAGALAAADFASPADIDLAMRLGAGYPKGPFELLGAEGTDTAEAAVQSDPSSAVPGRVIVIGTGIMGQGIAQVFALAGAEAMLVGLEPGDAQVAVDGIDSRLQSGVERGRITADEHQAARARLRAVAGVTEAAGADLAIEVVFEEVSVKHQVLAEIGELDRQLPLATNTSSFTVGEIADGVVAPERVFGLHFFNPAPAMKLVEVVGGSETNPELVELGRSWARGLGKTPVSCGDGAGFIVNRLLIPYLNGAARACSARALQWEEADAAIREELGHPMGPFELMDLIGLDVIDHALHSMYERLGGDRFLISEPIRALVAEGQLGRKTGSGFYDYKTS